MSATAQIFGRGIAPDRLYAAYASFDERGARKYCTMSNCADPRLPLLSAILAWA